VATGEQSWSEAWERGTLRVSGHRANLTAYLPLA
jgi:hypothetical protein